MRFRVLVDGRFYDGILKNLKFAKYFGVWEVLSSLVNWRVCPDFVQVNRLIDKSCDTVVDTWRPTYQNHIHIHLLPHELNHICEVAVACQQDERFHGWMVQFGRNRAHCNRDVDFALDLLCKAAYTSKFLFSVLAGHVWTVSHLLFEWPKINFDVIFLKASIKLLLLVSKLLLFFWTEIDFLIKKGAGLTTHIDFRLDEFHDGLDGSLSDYEFPLCLLFQTTATLN